MSLAPLSGIVNGIYEQQAKAYQTKTSIVDEIKTLAADIALIPRLSREQLMRALARCYALGLTPMDKETRQELFDYFVSIRKGEGANRSYVALQKETPYTIIVRSVFAARKESHNAHRYIGALNYLYKQNVPADKFGDAVAHYGGITELYWKNRNREGRQQARSKLTLNTTLVMTIGVPVTITLLPEHNGTMTILEIDGVFQ